MTTPKPIIYPLQEVSPEDAAQLKALFGHLVATPQAEPCEERLRAIVANPHAALFVARTEGEIVGALTIAHLSLPTSEKLWIEDVVVSPAARGQGLGRKLVMAAQEWGRNHYPSAVIYLTSNPSRTAARALYRSLGFEEYNTGVFKFSNQ